VLIFKNKNENSFVFVFLRQKKSSSHFEMRPHPGGRDKLLGDKKSRGE